MWNTANSTKEEKKKKIWNEIKKKQNTQSKCNDGINTRKNVFIEESVSWKIVSNDLNYGSREWFLPVCVIAKSQNNQQPTKKKKREKNWWKVRIKLKKKKMKRKMKI